MHEKSLLHAGEKAAGYDLRVGEGPDKPVILKVKKESTYFYITTREKKTVQNILSI